MTATGTGDEDDSIVTSSNVDHSARREGVSYDDDRSIDTFDSGGGNTDEDGSIATSSDVDYSARREGNGRADAKDMDAITSASLGVSDLEPQVQYDEEPVQPHVQRRNSNLRSSFLLVAIRSSQKSLRRSKQISKVSLDPEDLLNGDDEDLKSNIYDDEEEPPFFPERRPSIIRISASNEPTTEPSPTSECTPLLKKTIKTVTTQNSQVFFMIGCQRSGSNWLRTMLSEREDLIAPHPAHIMRDFMPKLGMYGDLTVQANLKILIDHVCAFAERNQVQWLDLHSRPMEFKRSSILMEVMVTLECFHFKEKHIAIQNGREAVEKVDNPYFLLAIFDAIMNAMTMANGKKIWMCKSMGMSKFHDYLLSFYGKERLRYIYLVRDPRDVCLSFMKTPVGDCHPYAIAKKWANLQNFAVCILHETPELIIQVCYEEVLGDRLSQVAKIVEFMGARDVCRSMRRGSIIAIKSEKDVVSGAKKGREAKMANTLSCQFKNLSRGESFIAGQFKKWAKEMKEEDIMLVESVAFDEMQRLGYDPHLVKIEEDRIDFTEELCQKYAAENERLIEKMNTNLSIVNPDDLQRRKIQAAVLKKITSEHYDEEFVNTFFIDIDDALDSMDDMPNDKGFLQRRNSATANFKFQQWPRNASMVGFQPDFEVSERFEVKDTQTLKLKGGISITFAAASQGGYYPSERDKTNQDAYIAGARVGDASNSRWKKRKDVGILFAVFDGHGPNGADCARQAREHVGEQFVEGMKDDSTRKQSIVGGMEDGDDGERESLDESWHVTSTLSKSYNEISSLLETGEVGIDAAHSGCTATSLFVTKDFLHTANVGDSRCLLIEQDKRGETSVKALTVDHTPDREDEIKRIEAHGGVVMTSDQYDIKDPTFTSFEQKRIWSKNGKWPGTAFTRSIGDAVATELGVCSEPECANFPIPTSDVTFVLGSDGVFDFIPDEEIGAVVKEFEDPAEACRVLIGKAWNRWCESEERTDDITVIVGHVNHSKRSILVKLRSLLDSQLHRY